ncbi:ABC transporter substrate-binding protein [Clostridium polyendosporum]|uniref:ABC transporter substrate-binding protein n=1 Tax=Clostridium polyendosporum TaxID=69208 RepID=A0A919VD39_9CLOT|nr:ABC transporter substrate-binding protein [Clostridium polyendosporum]GIM27584.1 ABC transporter substrate-binding protein [Clostridium polyendosporum]
MNKRKKKITILIMLGMLSLIFTACGESKKSNYQKILNKKEMTFAMTAAYPPFNFKDENGNLAGFDIDIANAIAEKMGVKANPITTEWNGLIPGLKGNRFDMVIGSMAITEDRLKEVDFSNPYYYDGAQFFSKKNSGFKSIQDIKDGKVGVVTGTTFHNSLQKMDNIKEILQFESDVDNMKALEQGRSDGLVTGKWVGVFGAKKFGINIEPVGGFIYKETIGIAMKKGEKDLVEAVNKALKEIIEDGTYEEISEKWFNTNLLKTN